MAAAVQLQVEVRENLGKIGTKKCRDAGKIPGVVYANGREPVAVAVSQREFNRITRNRGQSALVELEGLPAGKTLAVYKHLQLHPVSYATRHIDFQAVADHEKVSIPVKVILKGLPIGVDKQGGVLTRAADYVTIACLPKDIPDTLTFDVSHLEVGDALHLGDAKLDEKYSLVSSGGLTLASVNATREALSKKGAADAEAEAAPAKAGAKAAAKPAAEAPKK